MTPQTITLGTVLIAASVTILVGAFIAWGVRDWWAERQAKRADESVRESAAATQTRLNNLTPKQQEAWEKHVAEALAKTERLNLTPPRFTPLPGRRIASVPQQFDGSDR